METTATIPNKTTMTLAEIEERIREFLTLGGATTFTTQVADELLKTVVLALGALPSCIRKAKPDEPLFVLRGQEVTADLTTDFWGRANAIVNNRIGAGVPMAQALLELRESLQTHFSNFADEDLTPKIHGALDLAQRMAVYPGRKQAD